MTRSIILYIFAASDVPDVYINVIAKSRTLFDLTKVVLLGIEKDRIQKARTDIRLNLIKARIKEQLSSLINGDYVYIDQASKQLRKKQINIDQTDRDMYEAVREIHIDIETIIYQDLESRVNYFLEKNNRNCIFDVSAILKGYLVDVFVILLSKQVEDIYTFELKGERRTYDEMELIHILSLNEQYEFINITKSDNVKDKIIKTKPEKSALFDIEAKLKTSISEYLLKKLDKFIDIISSNYANTVFVIYTACVVIFFAVVSIFILTYWNSIEPWTFILFGMPLLPYLGSLMIQLIFKKEFSLQPERLFYWLKNYRVETLRKKLEFLYAKEALEKEIHQVLSSLTGK